jgi:hypothetical protein
MNSPFSASPLAGAVVALALGIVLGVVGVVTVASVAGQEAAAQATPVEVLEYGTR